MGAQVRSSSSLIQVKLNVLSLGLPAQIFWCFVLMCFFSVFCWVFFVVLCVMCFFPAAVRVEATRSSRRRRRRKKNTLFSFFFPANARDLIG
jgi:hypothetical protein